MPESKHNLKASLLSRHKLPLTHLDTHVNNCLLFAAANLAVARWPMRMHECMVRVLAVTVCLERFVCNHGLITASFVLVLVVYDISNRVTNCGLKVSLVVCRVLAGMGGIRHTAKFILPLRAKNPSSLPLMLLAGHCLSQVTCSAMLSATLSHLLL